MPDDEEEPKDWEIEEVDPPESLKRKWIEDDRKPKEPVDCPACHKPVSSESLSCIFCGALIYGIKPPSTGWLTRFRAWLKQRFKS